MTEQAEAGISTADAVALWFLKLKYDGCYHVSLTHGTWRAIRDTDPLAVLTAKSGGQLADKIRSDMEQLPNDFVKPQE